MTGEQIIADSFANLVGQDWLISDLIHREVGNKFAGRYNDILTANVPGTSALPERKVPVQLDSNSYNVVQLQDEELTLSARDYVDQIVARQARAVAESIESHIADWLDKQPIPPVWVDRSGVEAAIKAAHAVLDGNGVGQRRVVLLGAGLASLLRPFEQAWECQAGAHISELDLELTRNDGCAFASWKLPRHTGYVFHRTAVVLKQEAPSLPKLATNFRGAHAQGFRWLQDYDPASTSDRSVFDTLIGLELVKDDDQIKRIVKVQI